MTCVKQAVFLVGGRGTRLGAISAHTPKPLLEIAPGLRFIDVLLDQAARHGFNDIILVAGHLGEQVEALYQKRRVREATVTVVREPEPAGTGGALDYVRDRLDPWFLLANGDSYFDINLRTLAAGPRDGFLGRLALRQVPDVSRYGSVALEGDHVVLFGEKRAGGGDGLINAGIYVFDRSILDHIRVPCSLEVDVLPHLAAAGRLRGACFEGFFLDIGLPDALEQARREVPRRLVRPAVFFDRDGVLNHDLGYTYRPEDLQWIAGAREAVLALNEAGYYVFVATNQAGVARGYYGEAEVAAFHNRMQQELAEIGAHIDAFYYCPFHDDAVTAPYRAVNHHDRKPNPGMLLRALREWPVDTSRSFVIGDRQTDIEAAHRAGLKGFLFNGSNLAAFTQAALTRSD